MVWPEDTGKHLGVRKWDRDLCKPVMPCRLWSSWLVPSSTRVDPRLCWDFVTADVSPVMFLLLEFLCSGLSGFMQWPNTSWPKLPLQTWASCEGLPSILHLTQGPQIQTGHSEVAFEAGTPEANAAGISEVKASTSGDVWSLFFFLHLECLQSC